MSRSFHMKPPADELLRPGERVLVQVVPRRPRQAGVVQDVRTIQHGVVLVMVRLEDGREIVRSHVACRRSGFQPGEN